MKSEQAPREEHLAAVAAGLAGSLLSLLLARRNYRVDLFEKREDFRQEVEDEQTADETVGQLSDSQKRSINLTLSHRGREALRAVELEDEVLKRAVPLGCRAIHSKDGSMRYQPYSSSGECLYSASRQMLNHLLLDVAEKFHNVRMFFGCKITNIAKDGTLHFTKQDGTQESKKYRCVFGADGAYSAVRQAILRQSRANFSQEYIAHGYKELTMPPSENGDYVLPSPNALHVWPRHEFMMIALPNPDKSFTCNMFAPHEKCK
jgi:kynurenine 3-monooxygenase